MDYYLASVLVFTGILALVLYKDRANVDRKFGIFFMRRTQKGKKFVDALAKASPTFWRLMGDLGVLTGFGAMVYGLYFLVKQATAPSAGPGLALLIPLPSSSAVAGQGYVGIPFWFFIVGIAALVIVHEGSHAVQVRLAGVKIKSMGLALFAVIPGAFVEPDEKGLKKKSWRSQARVYAAGSFGNFVLAILTAIVLTFVLSPIFSVGAVDFRGYVAAPEGGEPYPAQIAELKGPIVALDGQAVHDTETFASILSKKKPGDTVIVQTPDDEYRIRLAAHPEDNDRAFLGVG